MSSKQILIIVGPLCVLVMAVAAFALLRTPAGASEPIQAAPLTTLTMEEQATVTESAEEIVLVEPAETSAGEEPAVDTSGETDAETEPAGVSLLFEIDPSLSQVQFTIDEILRGSPFTAVGVTNQVTGQIALDPADFSTAQLGVIQVNARTLVTDDDFRNRALNNQILDTDQYEYITFTPTALEGLPDNVNAGETVNFTIIGDLTIRDVTQQVAFDAAVKLVSESELQGTAEATILRSDYDLTIPSVRQVAEVSDELVVTIDFVATVV
jgi:polyisoprenoid-binding protein YceI